MLVFVNHVRARPHGPGQGLRREHTLVVGGTGMLASVVRALADRGHEVSVVARERARLEALTRQRDSAGGVHPLAPDYRDSGTLRATLDEAKGARGPITLAICWIHGSAPEAPLIIADCIGHGTQPARFFQILGSATRNPSVADRSAARGAGGIPGLRYRRIVLGFVRESTQSRWLTYEEISAGLLAAVDADSEAYVIGQVRPWELRP